MKRGGTCRFRLVIAMAAAFGLARGAATVADTPAENRGSFLVDPRPVAKTPRFLGANIEILEHHDRINQWDWLADSGMGMARVFHLGADLRTLDGKKRTFESIRTKDDFDAYRRRLAADPDREVDWAAYRFADAMPMLGSLDGIVGKLTEAGVMPAISMGYGPGHGPRKLLLKQPSSLPVTDDLIDWGSAAAAYENYLAMIHRYATQYGVTHFMMLNEPTDKPELLWPIGVLARVARMAFDDVRGRLPDRALAARLCLSGPAINTPWEVYWPHVAEHVDCLDFHHYDPDPRALDRKYARAALRARPFGKKVALSEFNLVSGGLQPEQSLLCLRPSLYLADMLMSLLSAPATEDPGCEFALLYQFAFPATHRNFKSLVYGDMNLVDWTLQERAIDQMPRECQPTAEQLQLRVATPAYHVFKMFTRCTPGRHGDKESYDVLPLTESKWGFGPAIDPVIRQHAYSRTERQRYLALGGTGADLRTLAVRAGDRLMILVLNLGPAPVKKIGVNLELLSEPYATAVVRETSLVHRDAVIQQQSLAGDKLLTLDFPAESVTQIILTPEDLTLVKELKLEEQTFTPGTAAALGLLETTRLRALGRIGDRWLDLTDLNVAWSSSAPDLVAVYQGGMVQRVRPSAAEITITAKTLEGVAAHPLVVPPAPSTLAGRDATRN